ncbi:MAG: DUF4160 domain-containing protein [Arcicella sp.]|jgi:hypothetical protein|nr:DUF4160 domain-containing protein [Arcicella sp.]
MPQISRFLGIIIMMFYDDHNPPHFHAQYGEFKAIIGINDFALLEGKLPAKTLGLVVEWAVIHQEELMINWELMKEKKPMQKIDPLQ